MFKMNYKKIENESESYKRVSDKHFWLEMS